MVAWVESEALYTGKHLDAHSYTIVLQFLHRNKRFLYNDTYWIRRGVGEMDKFEQLQNLVGADGIKKILQASALEAINSGDWHKVRTIADFAINGVYQQKNSYNNRQQDPLSKLEDLDFSDLEEMR
ncbi:MAG TPA: hypothetical protein V6C90_18540 [Coleofasciculaceae cyanobacterium]|jgi:hypothetical protein